MSTEFYLLLVGIFALVGGSILGYYTRQNIAKRQAGTIEAKINQLLFDAKKEAQETLIKAKNKAVKILEDIKEEEKERQAKLFQFQSRLEKREVILDDKLLKAKQEENELAQKIGKVREIKSELEELREKEVSKLEEVSQLTKDQARERLFQKIERENEKEILEKLRKLELSGKEQLDRRAQEILTQAIQKYGSSHASEITTTSFLLPSEEMKGRIIGKEGRNIKTLEKLTGVEFIIDETPETVVISGFDPIRRQIAKLALEKLIADGRIQPAKIEETVEKVKQELAVKIKELGEAAVFDAGILGLDPKIVHLLGRLHFRTSYGQNVLLHSLEVCHLAGALASELGANVQVAKSGGLLHDIGKAVNHEIEGTHVEIGINILRKFGVEDSVIQAMKSHHEDYPYETLEAIIVQTADAISGARPGARKDTLENYLKRLGDLEAIAANFEGIEKVYAIQAGRELRVFVNPEQISDLEAQKLAKAVAARIEEELRYPGEIKVVVMRETRVTEYAK